MCANKQCPRCQQCYRYRAVPDKYWQSYFDGDPAGSMDCGYFMPLMKGDRLQPADNKHREGQ
jgi:hypothetical protein